MKGLVVSAAAGLSSFLPANPTRVLLGAALGLLVLGSCAPAAPPVASLEEPRAPQLAAVVERRVADGTRVSRARAPGELPPGDGAPHERPPAPAAAQAPADFESVAVQRPAIRLDGASADALPTVLGHPDVRFASVVRFTMVEMAGVDGRPSAVRVAAVDPRGFRVLTPQVTADVLELWQHLVDGGAVVDHGAVERLGLELGGPLVLNGGQPLRIGAFASIGHGPTADVIVSAATGLAQGLGGDPSMIVSVSPQVSPSRVAGELAELTGGEASTLVPDPVELGVTRVSPHEWHDIWDRLAACESSGRWHLDAGNGYYGGLQFLPESWYYVGGTGMPHEASREEQIAHAKILLALQGWEAWPECSTALGFR